LNVIDGRPISSGKITHNTIKLQMYYSNHCENIILDITSLGKYPIILGIPWLKQHNPYIDWPTHYINFKQSNCTNYCINTKLDIHEKSDEILAILNPSYNIFSTNTDLQDNNHIIQLPDKYKEYKDVFSKEEADKLPPYRNYDHKINLLPNTNPPFGPIYSLSEPELKALHKYLDENLAKDFIQPSISPAGAPILFVKKKDGTLRLVVNYRGLNNVTIKNRYPLPLIGELIDRLRTSIIFTKIDLRGAYNLVRITSGDEWKTSFRIRYGYFEYKVMPFGLCNAPATFQHFMNEILADYLDKFAVVYLDDILIFSSTRDEHFQHVKLILERLRKHSLYGKLEKCQFHQTKVEFLGYIVSKDGIKMDPSKIDAIQSWPEPTNVKELQAFIGFSNFYRRFINKFSFTILPLTKLLKKDVKWNWSEEATKSFLYLKNALISAPILKYFDPNKKIVIEVDASDFAVGGILSQINVNNIMHPVAYFSRKLTNAELNYEIYNKDMLAIITAFKEWRAYLEGAQYQITVLTDHKNLEYFLTTKALNRRQAR